MLSAAVGTIFRQDEEERCWSLYCACAANPFTEDITFRDFVKQCRGEAPNRREPVPAESELNDRQIREQTDRARRILQKFTPPKKGGC